MKKRTMAVGGLLMAVAMTSYSVAGTYAKYTSSIDLTDEARVAKWELTAKKNCRFDTTTGEGDRYICDIAEDLDLFANSYSLDSASDGKKVYVQSFDGDNVVAPGTSGIFEAKFGGAMEVRHDFQVNFDTDNEIAVYYKFEDGKLFASKTAVEGYKKYSPIIYTIHIYGNGVDNTITGNLDQIKSGLADWNKDTVNNNIAPGRLGMTVDISWKWDTMNGFADDADVTSTAVNADGLTAAQVNELDTYIGKNWSQWYPDVDHKGGANDLGNEAKFTLNVSATQIAEDYSTKTN